MSHWHQFLNWVHEVRGLTHVVVGLLFYHAHKARTWNRDRKLKLAVARFRVAADPAAAAAQFATDVETIVGDVAQAADVISKASLWTAIIGFFTALPGIVQLIQQLWSWANTVSGGNPGTLISNFGSAMGDLTSAQTQEDRDAALSEITNLFPKLP